MKNVLGIGFARTATFQGSGNTRDIDRVFLTISAQDDDGTPIDVNLDRQFDRFKAAEAAAQIAVQSLQSLVEASNVNQAHRGFVPAEEATLLYLDLRTGELKKGA